MSNKYVLFSAVGSSDPIYFNHDGAILHICRYYRPEKLYLFFSKEMNYYHKLDDRYRITIRKLSEIIPGYDPEIIPIIDENLTEVHKFDIFYQVFEDELKKAHDDNPEYIILINVSSGTTAMKCSLNLIAALHGRNYQAIQVSSPYTEHKKLNDYNIMEEWKLNIDNGFSQSADEKAEKRAEPEKNLNLTARIKKEMIKKHLLAYDYQAALTIAEEIEPDISSRSFHLLRAACFRIQLYEEGVNGELKDTGINIIPVSQKHGRNPVEYLLWLQVKQSRKDYADFIRGITPVIADLFVLILESQTGIKLTDFADYNKNKQSYYVTRNKLEKTQKGKEYLQIFDQYFNRKMKDKAYSSEHALALMKYYYKGEQSLLEDMKKLRNVENKVRNPAAHTMVSITDQWIMDNCGFSSSKIMGLLKRMADYAGVTKPAESSEVWDSYDRMNTMILNSIMSNED